MDKSGSPFRLPVALRAVLTATGLFCVALRLFRVGENWESVERYYKLDPADGLVWLLLEAALLAGPFLAALAAALAPWLRDGWTKGLGLAAACISAFFTLEEGLTCFARAVNGNGGYVGAEPLLSAVICAAAGGGGLLPRRGRG